MSRSLCPARDTPQFFAFEVNLGSRTACRSIEMFHDELLSRMFNEDDVNAATMAITPLMYRDI